MTTSKQRNKFQPNSCSVSLKCRWLSQLWQKVIWYLE